MKMTISQAFLNALMGYAVVFLGIALLVLVVYLMGKAMTAKKPAAAPAPVENSAAVTPIPHGPASEAPGAAGDLKLYDTPDRDAAMIMAIVADELKMPLNELRFISIREVHKK